MPYISAEQVKTIRQRIKAVFPKFRFSIRKDNYAVVSVTVLSGPIAPPSSDLFNVNHFYINDHYSEYPQWRKLLGTIKTIINDGNGGHHDGDYGFVPNWYTNIKISREYVTK